MGELGTHLNSLQVYLRDGVTWSRLKMISTHGQDVGGLALMSFGSASYHEFFKQAPPTMIDERPECTVMFLKWLLPRQFVLRKLVERDLSTRSLKMYQARDAIATLSSEEACVLRHVHYVLLKKSLFLFYWIEGHPYIAEHTSMDALVERAVNIIKDTKVDEYILEYMGCTMEDLRTQAGWDETTEMHWVETVVHSITDLPREQRGQYLEVCMDCFRMLSLKMCAHLQLTLKQIVDRSCPLWRVPHNELYHLF